MPSLGSFCARRARRSKYSWAVMPGVTGGRRVTMLLLLLRRLLMRGWLELKAWTWGIDCRIEVDQCAYIRRA